MPVARNESPARWVYSIQSCEVCAFPGDEVYCPDCVAAFKAAFDEVRERRRPRTEAG